MSAVNPESPNKEHIPYWQRIQSSLKEPETPAFQVQTQSPLKQSMTPESAKNSSKGKLIELKSPSPPKKAEKEPESIQKSSSKTQDLQKLIEEVTKKEEKWTKD